MSTASRFQAPGRMDLGALGVDLDALDMALGTLGVGLGALGMDLECSGNGSDVGALSGQWGPNHCAIPGHCSWSLLYDSGGSERRWRGQAVFWWGAPYRRLDIGVYHSRNLDLRHLV